MWNALLNVAKLVQLTLVGGSRLGQRLYESVGVLDLARGQSLEVRRSLLR